MGGLARHTPDEVRRWAWIRGDAQQVQDLFGLVHQAFPDKEIWVTEWGLNATQYIGAHPEGGNKDVRFQVHQTMLAVLYNARFMLNTACHVPYVPVMTYWTLYGQETMDILDGNRTTINFEMFRLLRWAREGNDRMACLTLAGAHPAYSIQAIGTSGNVVTVPANSLSVLHAGRMFEPAGVRQPEPPAKPGA